MIENLLRVIMMLILFCYMYYLFHVFLFIYKMELKISKLKIIEDLLLDIDYCTKKGVRPFIRYSESTGKYSIECYRKMTQSEIDIENNKDKELRRPIWKFIRVGHVGTYFDMYEAARKSVELAFNIIKENNF